MVKSILLNLIFLIVFNVVYILNAFLLGYASNPNRYSSRLVWMYVIVVILQLLLNAFISRKLKFTFLLISSIFIVVTYLFFYKYII